MEEITNRLGGDRFKQFGSSIYCNEQSQQSSFTLYVDEADEGECSAQV